MTPLPPGFPGDSGDPTPPFHPAPPLDPTEQRLASLLADLADDPDAPVSTVTAESVLAAVRAQSQADEATGPVPGMDVSVRTAGSEDSVVDGRKRFQGRRGVLIGVLAAACLAAVAAVVIPLSLRSSETSTSAESALDGNRTSTALAAQGVPGQSAAGGSDAEDSAAEGSAAAGDSVLGQPPEAASGQADAALSGESPAPAAAGGNAASSPACAWAPLSPAAAAALTRSLPAGRFGAPAELIADCPAEPVAGARLLDATGGSLVVTVSTAVPGACASGSSNLDATGTGVRCVSQGSGRYLFTDAGGAQTAFAYAGGIEVAVGQDRSGTGLPDGSPLTADQLSVAAQAVLGAQG